MLSRRIQCHKIYSLALMTSCSVIGTGTLFSTQPFGALTSVAWAAAQAKVLFAEPLAPQVEFVTEFIGRDQDRVRSMNFSPAAVSERLSKIQSLTNQFQAQKGKPSEAMKMGNALLILHLEQSMYLENLRGVGMTDRRYPDLEHFIRVSRRSVIGVAAKLLSDYGKSPLARSWQVASLESRMRVRDPAVFKEAAAFVGSNQGSQDAARIQALGAALVHTKKLQGNYGTIVMALSLDLDVHSRAALKLLVAESLVKRDPTASLRYFTESAKEGLSIRRPDGAPGPITGRASSRLLAEALSKKPTRPSQEVVEFLQSMGLKNHLKFYLERCAMNNLPKDIPSTIDGYDSLQRLAKLSETETIQVERQNLELALESSNPVLVEERWRSFGRFQSEASNKETNELISNSQNLFWAVFSKSPTPENGERFVRMHDFLSTYSKDYASDAKWQLRAVEALYRSGNFPGASNRADTLAKASNVKSVKIEAMRFSSRSKEKILGIGEEPNFADAPKLRANGQMVVTYIDVNEVLSTLVSGQEAERSAYYAAFLTFQIENPVKGKTDYLTVTSRFPKSKYASAASLYALDTSVRLNDHVFVEAFARHLEKIGIRLSDKRYANLRSVIELAVYAQASSLQEAKKHIEAADKFVAFQAEFPKSDRADMALHLASRNYTSGNQAEKSVAEMEKLLKFYPKSKLAKETRWAAAEQSRSIGQLLRAANHYASFGTEYPKEGKDRKAWLVAAELQKGLGRFSHSISMYEKHLATAGSKQEKVSAAREMAMLQHKYGSPQEALAAYDRVMKTSGEVKDEAWARYHIVEILLRQGMEREARGEAVKLASLQVLDQDSLGYQSKIRYQIGKLDAMKLVKAEPNLQADLLGATQKLVSDYNAIKKELIAPCEVPGSDFCSVGYFEVAKLAESVAGILLEVAPPPTIDPAIANKVTSLSKAEAERLVAESLAYAQQADASLAQGAPDSETADLIRAYSQRASGKDFAEVPD